MLKPSSSSAREGILLPALLALTPILLFFGVLVREAINIPFRDDYDTVIGFAVGLAERQGSSQKLAFFLSNQSNEYKLFFLHAAVWIQVALLHKINFWLLSVVGDAFVLLIGVLLWKMFLPAMSDLNRRLTLFLPVLYLLFQLRFVETLDWATASMQHLPCLFFSFAALYLLMQREKPAFTGALASLALAVASSGNGFVLVPIGVLLLVLARRFLALTGWLLVSAVCVAAYSFHYVAVNQSARQSVGSLLIHLHPTYVLLFLGSIAARPALGPAIVLGSLLCAYLAYLAYTGFPAQDPLVSACILYLLLVAFGVACLRADLGPVQISTSRYTIYSALLLAFCWFAFVERSRSLHSRPPLRVPSFLGVLSISMLFGLTSFFTGWHSLQKHNLALITGMAAFEHPVPPQSTYGPVVPLEDQDAEHDAFDRRARAEFLRALELRLYNPPPL